MYGEDYLETFSPIAKVTSIRITFVLAVHFAWPLYQFDKTNDFLHDNLQEEINMTQPLRFNVHWACPLQKSLYGLKQSPQA